MALTKPRASQIYDIDYKQATRVLTSTNINLSGGAPNQVDGVNLSLNDRVLVIGQNTGSENGIYLVDTVGSGANGTWIRTSDTDVSGELLAGTIVMVTEGLVYHDTQWKLTTNNPIVIGTTALTFEQNSAFAFGNIYANNTAVLATSVGDVLTLTAGNNISIVGNNTSKSVSIGVTGISLTSISDGTSNVAVVSTDGNVTVGVDGTSNVAVFSSGGLDVSGNITGNGVGLSGIEAFKTISVSGQDDVVAGNIGSTVTLEAGTGIAILTDSANSIVTIASSSSDNIFATGGDMGTIDQPVTSSQDMGSVTEVVVDSYDLGSVVSASGIIYPSLLVLPSYTSGTLPSANPAGQLIYLSSSGVGVMTAFSDGTNWRYTSTGGIVS